MSISHIVNIKIPFTLSAGCILWCIYRRKQANINPYANAGYRRVQMQVDSIISDTNGLLISWIQFIDTRRETQFSKNLCWPHKRAADFVMFKISVCRVPKNTSTSSTAQIQLSTQISASISTLNCLFFKILKFSGLSLPGMTSSTLQPISYSGVYYDNGDCQILCARA